MKKTKKLTLTRETLRTLDRAGLVNAAGGTTVVDLSAQGVECGGPSYCCSMECTMECTSTLYTAADCV